MNEINASFSALQVKNLDELKNVMPVGQKFLVKDGTQIKNELIKEKLTIATKVILKSDAAAKINDLSVRWQRKDDETRNMLNQTSDLSVYILERDDSYYLNGHGDYHLSYSSNSYEAVVYYKGLDDAGVFVSKNKGYFTSLQSKDVINLTQEAYSNTLQTPYGDVKVFFDLYGDNDKLGIGELENNKKLFNFDSNGDGFVNSNDENFSKLKVRGYDKDGNEKIMSLNEATQGRGVDLAKFISQEIIDYTQKLIEENNARAIKENRPNLYIDPDSYDKRISYYYSNPYTAFAPESRYKKLGGGQIDEFFNSYADDDGWVNLNNQTMAGFNNLAYLKAGFDGSVKLSEFNPIISSNDYGGMSYGEYQKDSFMKFYSDYKKESKAHEQDVSWLINNLKAYEVDEADELSSKLLESKSAYMIAMENDFKKATGLSFSLSNLEKVRKLFESDQDKAAASLADSDSVIAIRKNKNGTFTLKFDSGRMIDVNELYSDTGTLLTDKNGTRASINLEAKIMDEITLNKLDFSSVGIYDEGRYKTLKEIGAEFIKSVATKHGTQFLITLANNEKISTNELYNIATTKEILKHIDPKDKLYQKVDRVV